MTMHLIHDYKRLNSKEKKQLLFVCLMWGVDLLYYIKAVVLRIPVVNTLAEYFVPSCVVVAVLLCFGSIKENFKAGDYMFCVTGVIVYLSHLVIFPQNNQWQEELFSVFVFSVLPYYFVGLVIDAQKHLQYLEIISFVYVVLGTFYMAFFVSNNGTMVDNEQWENMGKAYALLPHSLLLIYSVFKRPRIWNAVGAAVSLFTIMGTGNRGSLLIIIFFLVGYPFVSGMFRRRIIGSVVLLGVFILGYTYINDIVLFISEGLTELGFSARAFDSFLEGDFIADSNGRDIITEILLGYMFADNGIWGYGLCSDRTIVGQYSHNLFIELCMSFGIVVGVVLFAAILYFVIRAMKDASTHSDRSFLLILLGCGFVVLFISDSFIELPFFYVMLGYAIAIIRRRKRAVSNQRYGSRNYAFVDEYEKLSKEHLYQ